LGFLDFLILKLMREARENGKLLSDVVEVTWEHLKFATKPICYLRALLRNPVDFRYQLRRKNQDVAERKTKLKVEAQAEQVARESAGHTFTDATGETTYVIGADGESMSVYKAGEGIGREATNWKAAFAQAKERGFAENGGKDQRRDDVDVQRPRHANDDGRKQDHCGRVGKQGAQGAYLMGEFIMKSKPENKEQEQLKQPTGVAQSVPEPDIDKAAGRTPGDSNLNAIPEKDIDKVVPVSPDETRLRDPALTHSDDDKQPDQSGNRRRPF
jgi:hypothetical protein